MAGNKDFLEMENETPSERRARILAENDGDMLSDLIALRKSKRITQQVLAERMGVTQATVASFERYDSDPKLSTIRRYAHALEALINHVVVADNDQFADGSVWRVLSFTADAAIRVQTHRPSYSTAALANVKRTDLAVAA